MANNQVIILVVNMATCYGIYSQWCLPRDFSVRPPRAEGIRMDVYVSLWGFQGVYEGLWNSMDKYEWEGFYENF